MQTKKIILISLSCLLSLSSISSTTFAQSKNISKHPLLLNIVEGEDKNPNQEFIREQSRQIIDTYEVKLSIATDSEERFHPLTHLVVPYIEVNNLEKAEAYLKELEKLTQEFKDNWNYQSAIHYLNIGSGRLALRRGDIEQAGLYLIEAGKTKGSPALDSFGPNMSLAKELLEKGQIKPVVKYFKLCEKFWKMHDGRLQKWTELAKQGNIPDFGANLLY